jgi:hypothetical protein
MNLSVAVISCNQTAMSNGGGGTPHSSNDCINRESSGGDALVEIRGKFTDRNAFQEAARCRRFTYISTGLRAVK